MAVIIVENRFELVDILKVADICVYVFLEVVNEYGVIGDGRKIVFRAAFGAGPDKRDKQFGNEISRKLISERLVAFKFGEKAEDKVRLIFAFYFPAFFLFEQAFRLIEKIRERAVRGIRQKSYKSKAQRVIRVRLYSVVFPRQRNYAVIFCGSEQRLPDSYLPRPGNNIGKLIAVLVVVLDKGIRIAEHFPVLIK